MTRQSCIGKDDAIGELRKPAYRTGDGYSKHTKYYEPNWKWLVVGMIILGTIGMLGHYFSDPSNHVVSPNRVLQRSNSD